MPDVTTHNQTVRADRMEMLTTRERIPERVRRLEKAVQSGVIGGGGGGGGTGPPGPPGPLITRTTHSFTTASIAAGAALNFDDTEMSSQVIYSLTTNIPARVRAYGTAAHRSYDSARLVTVDPDALAACLLEVVTDLSNPRVDFDPEELTNLDSGPGTTIYFRVENLSVSASPVTVTLLGRRTE